MSKNLPPKYLIMDERYYFDPDAAICLDTAGDLNEARRAAKDQGGGVIVERGKQDENDKIVETING